MSRGSTSGEAGRSSKNSPRNRHRQTREHVAVGRGEGAAGREGWPSTAVTFHEKQAHGLLEIPSPVPHSESKPASPGAAQITELSFWGAAQTFVQRVRTAVMGARSALEALCSLINS